MKHKIEIFVIDDDESMIDAIESLFKEYGFENFRTFNDPKDLLENLNANVLVCIVDYNLKSTMTGLELIKKIVNINRYCYFIMLSGQSDIKVVVDYLNSIYGGRYIEKSSKDFAWKLIFHVRDLIKHISHIDKFYLNESQ